MEYDFYVQLPPPSSKTVVVNVNNETRIGDLRTKIFEKSDVNVDNVTFIIDGREVMNNDDRVISRIPVRSDMMTYIKIKNGPTGGRRKSRSNRKSRKSVKKQHRRKSIRGRR